MSTDTPIDPLRRALDILAVHDVTLDDEGPPLSWCIEQMRDTAIAEVSRLTAENAHLLAEREAALARAAIMEAALRRLANVDVARIERAHWHVAASERGEWKGRAEWLESHRAIVAAFPVNPGMSTPLARLQMRLAEALKQADGDDQERHEMDAADDFEEFGLGPRDDEDTPTWAERVREAAAAPGGPTT